MAILENLMEHIARETNLDPAQVRLNNLNSNESLHKIFPEFLKDIGIYKYIRTSAIGRNVIVLAIGEKSGLSQ